MLNDVHKAEIDKIILLITNEEQKPLERWIFALHTQNEYQLLQNLNQTDIEERFRDLMRKINIVDASLHPLESKGPVVILSETLKFVNCLADSLTFSIIVEMRDSLKLASDKVAASHLSENGLNIEQTKSFILTPWAPTNPVPQSNAEASTELQMLHVLTLGPLSVRLSFPFQIRNEHFGTETERNRLLLRLSNTLGSCSV